MDSRSYRRYTRPVLLRFPDTNALTANFYDFLSAGFPSDPTRIAIETGDGAEISYRRLDELAGRFASLLAGFGARSGERVAVQVEKSPEAIALYLGCMRAGAVYVPMNTAYRAREVDYLLGDAEPKVMICTPEAEGATRELAERRGVSVVLTLDQAAGGTAIEEDACFDPETASVSVEVDDIAALLYTSGTTGHPKGAMLSHGDLRASAEILYDLWGFSERDVLLHALPIFHIHGLFVATHNALLSGNRMLFLSRFDAAEVTRRLADATVFMGVPSHYARLLEHPKFTRMTCRNIRLFLCGSAPLPANILHRVEDRTGHRILDRYGMSESNVITSNPVDGHRIPDSVGLPIPAVEVRVVDTAGEKVTLGEVGVLEIRSPSLFKGYWRKPEETAARTRADGFFITQDLARIDEQGYVYLVGRAQDMIISGGYNVYPREVESCLDEIAGIAESAVIGVPHADFGEAVTAAVRRTPCGRDLKESNIIEAMKSQLANYKVPKRVFFVDQLPRNAMGKVMKNELRARYQDTFVADLSRTE